MFPIGSMIGLIVTNFVCDIKGRRFSVLLCICCLIIGNIMIVFGVWSQNIPIIVISYMISGFGSFSLIIISYIVFYDNFSEDLRQRSMIFFNVVWAFAQICFYIYDLFELRWDTFYIFIIIIPLSILGLFINKIMFQSPNFTLEHAKSPQSTIQVLKDIALFNQISENKKIQLSKLIYNYYAEKIRLSIQRGYHKISSLNIKRVIQKLFTNWYNLKIIVILSTAYLSDFLFYFGVEYSLNEIGYKYGTNMLLMGFTQLLGYGMLEYYSQKIANTKRIVGFILFYYVGGFFGMMFVFRFVIDSKIISTICICLSRFFMVCGYIFFSFLQTQSFRSKVRSTGAGIIQSLATLGIFICPYLLSSLLKKQIHPVHVLSITMLICVTPVLLLKQTLNNRLSAQIDQELL